MEAGFANSEIIRIADAVAREKNIPKDAVIEALEEAIRIAARRKYGHEHSVKAEIDRRTGEIRLARLMRVVEDDYKPEEESEENAGINNGNEITPITISMAKYKKEDAQIGDIISEPLPPIDLGRVAAQSAKQVITHKVREIERAQQFEEFKDRVGQIVSGIVEKIEYGNVIIKLGQNYEGVIKKDFVIRGEKIRQGDRIRALVIEVNKENKGPQIILSRTHNEFLAALFSQEVPEIYDGIIQIKAIARDPGSRAKIAVLV
jgi:N utilization substance protein A